MIILPHYSKTSLCKVIMGHSDRMHAESAPLNRPCSLKQASERCSGSALVARGGVAKGFHEESLWISRTPQACEFIVLVLGGMQEKCWGSTTFPNSQKQHQGTGSTRASSLQWVRLALSVLPSPWWGRSCGGGGPVGAGALLIQPSGALLIQAASVGHSPGLVLCL